MSRKDDVISQLRAGVETLLEQPNITLVRGKAQFVSPHVVAVGSDEYTAPHIIIATGSEAKMPPIEGIASPRVVTSTELLQLPSVPERLVIVGAGVIGMEFASAFSSFGSLVTVVEFLKECLPAMDSDLAKRLRKQMERQGVDFLMQTAVKRIDDGKVIVERKGKEQELDADVILIATGRKPRIEGLGLDKAGVAVERGAIVVDDNMQTNVEGLYAIGDVNGRQMLAHAATFQGFRAVNHILGKTDGIDLTIMPAAVFTHPEMASVGPTEDQFKANADVPYSCKKGYYRANGKALATDATEGLVKLIADGEGYIKACHVLGAHAADIAQEVAVLINRRTTLKQLSEMVHIHPTLGEVLHEASF